MKLPITVCTIALFACGLQAQTPAPPAKPDVRAAIREAIQQAKALRKTQEAISAALAEKKATRASLDAQLASTRKTLTALTGSIEKIDEQYASLNETQQSAVREAWSIAKLYGVLADFLAASAAKPDSPERDRDLLSNVTSTTRRAVMLDETLARLNTTERRPRG